MPSRKELPGDLPRKKLVNALLRLGFIPDPEGGKGSHGKVIWPRTQKTITVGKNIRKDVLYYLIKQIESCSGITWERIEEEL